MRPIMSLVVCLFATTSASAALHWEQTLLEFDPAPFEEKIEAVYTFTNTGTREVTITDTHASCGCTVPTLSKHTFAPGESGELHVHYELGEATGRQEKTITVAATAPEPTSYVLTLRVVIPNLFELEPRFQAWGLGESPKPKHITIRALHPELARPVTAESRDSRFAVDLSESAEEPGVFTVTITPGQTDSAMFTSITVATSAPAEKKRVLSLFATVR